MLVLFGVGMYYLSVMAERQANDYQLYRGNNLVQAIYEHQNNKRNSSFSSGGPVEPTPNQERVIINHDGSSYVLSDKPKAQPYRKADPLPTNEGQPGQPLRFSQQPPVNPVYK